MPPRGQDRAAIHRGNDIQGEIAQATEEAQDLVRGGTDGAIEELLDQPMLASVLEAGLAAFDLSCNGVGNLS